MFLFKSCCKDLTSYSFHECLNDNFKMTNSVLAYLLGSQAELIVYQCSGVRPSSSVRVHHFQIFSSPKPLGRSKPNFMEPLLERGTKVFINGSDHMTKIAATPIYGKNLQKSLSPEPNVL